MLNRLGRSLRSQQGIALPMALIALVLLLSLSVVLITLSRTEPTVATNHVNATRAHALAESGLEQALWAVMNPTATGGLASVPAQGATAGSPFDGSQFLRVSPGGGFTVAIVGVDTTEVSVTAVGQTTVSAASTTPTAKARVTAQYVLFPDMGAQVPCALCVRGDLQLTGSTNMDGSSGGSCGAKVATWSTGTTTLSGDATVNGTKTPASPTQYQQNQTDDAFNGFAFSPSRLAALRAIAKARGTYLKPSAANGTVTFSNVRDGIVFVDTYDTSCSPICSPAAGDTTTAVVGPNSFANASGFRGWLIVNGNMNVNGNFGGVSGLVFVTGDLSVTGVGSSGGSSSSSGSSGSSDGHSETSDGHSETSDGHSESSDGHSSGTSTSSGSNAFRGTVVVQRRLGTTDPKVAGNASVTFDCNAIQDNRPQTPGWALVPGTYKLASTTTSTDGHSDDGHASEGHTDDGHAADGHSDGHSDS